MSTSDAGGQGAADRQSGPPAAAVVEDTKPDSYAWKAIWASAVGYAMDGFDFLILGFALSARPRW